MRQVTQRLRDGRIEVADVPLPQLRPEGVLVDVRASLLSAGTERTKVITGRQSLLGKARARPDQVRQVIEKARKDGLRDTIDAVRMRLDQPAGLGYSCAGVVIGAGSRVRDLNVGDRVACGGAGAAHSDVDYVPANLCVRLVDGVSFEEGAFTTVGSIALHGIRQADARLGERVAVIGLGLVGQLAGQILRAAGCSVVGVDLDAELVEKAIENGAVDRGFSRSALSTASPPAEARDCDAVLITAATQSSDPVELAAALARDRARVVVVGDVGLALDRAAWYDKELDLRLSRSYGPGRYDIEYEEHGLDYPIGYVRWTERRNMDAFVGLMAARRIDVSRLVSESVEVEQAPAAYDRLAETTGSMLGVLLRYAPTAHTAMSDAPPDERDRIQSRHAAPTATATVNGVGVIGAGSFAQRVLIPSLRGAGFDLAAIASASGLSAAAAGERFGFGRVGTVDDVIGDPRVGLVAVATRHATHAELAESALEAGKHVFVEKPPAVTHEQLERLRDTRRATGLIVAVGFNRRHAPLARRMREHFADRAEPIELLYRVNAGELDSGHWLNDLDDGGGRLIGEGCHFVDFACWIVGALPSRVGATIGAEPSRPLAAAQRFAVSLSFPDGSVATVLYGAGSSARMGKEYVEAHSGGRSAALDDFRQLTLYGQSRAKRSRTRAQDKGHRAQCVFLASQIAGRAHEEAPDVLETMRVTLDAASPAAQGELLERRHREGDLAPGRGALGLEPGSTEGVSA